MKAVYISNIFSSIYKLVPFYFKPVSYILLKLRGIDTSQSHVFHSDQWEMWKMPTNPNQIS